VRYPDALPGTLSKGLPNKDEAKKSLELANEIVEFVKIRLGLTG